MNSVDERVVKMAFDNAQFQLGVRTTLDSLAELNKGLKLQGASKGLTDLGSAAKNLDLSHISSSLDSIKSKFSLMSVAGIAAIANVANRAVDSGIRMAKAFTVDPIKAGLSEYELKMTSIQTILANTSKYGTTLKDVTSALDDLNTYSDKTIYSFSDMTKNVGLFTNAGIRIEDATSMIKGFSNEAAASGTNAEQAAGAAYQLSQAMSSGKVTLMDWRSLTNAGMGGANMKSGLIELASAMDTFSGKSVTAKDVAKDFNGSLEKGWMTADVMQNYLKIQAGDLSAAQMKALGLSNEQITAFQKQAKTAEDAATKVKTLTQLLSTVKETIGSGWSQSFEIIFGDFEEAKKLWTGVNDVLSGIITKSANARNKILTDWDALGGRTLLISSIGDAFKALGSVIKPIQEAFRTIFPAQTGKNLYDLTVGFSNLVKSFKMGVETTANLKRTFAGFFAIFDIGWQILKQTAQWLGSLLGPLIGKGSGGILKFTGNLGDMLVNLDKVVKKGVGLNKFFQGLETFIKPVITFLGMMIDYLSNLGQYIGPAFSKLGDFFGNIGSVLAPVYDTIKNFFANLFQGVNFEDALKVVDVGLFAALVVSISKLFKHFRSFGGFGGLISSITAPFTKLTETLDAMQKTLQAATLVEIAIAVAALAGSVLILSKIKEKDLDKALSALTMMFFQLFASLAAFNRIGGAKGLVATGAGLILIATAIRILVSSVKELADMSWEELKKGMAALGTILAALIITVRGMSAQSAGMITTGIGLVILAAAIKILVSSVQDFAKMSWSEIAKGLTGVAALLVALTLFTKFAETNKGGIAQGAGIILLAAGIKILASASEDFGKMKWSEIAKGLVSITAILAAIAIFSKTAGNPVTMLASGIALNGIALAMITLGKAMEAFGKLKWSEVAKGLTIMAVALGLISVAMMAMPPTSVLSGFALIEVAKALEGIAKAMKSMGKMSWNEVAVGLTVLAVALTLISAATLLMTSALPGAAAILIVSGAIAILAEALSVMGDMSWEEIAKSLTLLAGAFIVLGVAGLALTPVAPTLVILGAAMTLLGIGVALLGLGVLALSAGLTGLAVSGAAGASAIGLIVTTLIALLPAIAVGLGKFLVAASEAIIKAAPEILKAAIVLIDSILTAIITEAPKIVAAFIKLVLDLLDQLTKNLPTFVTKATKMIVAFLDAITKNAPKIISSFINMIVSILDNLAKKMPEFVTSAANLLVSFLKGIASKIGDVVDAGANIIVKFIEGIGGALWKIVDAAFRTIIAFLNALADNIETYSKELGDAGINIAEAIIKGLIGVIANAGGRLWSAFKGIFTGALGKLGSLLGINSPSKVFQQIGIYIIQGLVKGITGSQLSVTNAMVNVTNILKNALASTKKNIDSYQKTLAGLNSNPSKNAKAIYLTTLALQQAQVEYWKLNIEISNVNKKFVTQVNALKTLGRAYDAITPKIAIANVAVQDAIKIRDDFAKQIKDQENKLPDIAVDTQLTDYVDTLTYQINDLKKFTDVMAQLRKLGLNDALYSELLAKGPSSLGFAEQLLAGGVDAVKNVDSLSDQLTAAAGSLGTAAGSALYQAGVDAAQGIVDGLKKQQKALTDQMAVIAASLVAAIKKDLGIRSPSKVFSQLGEFVAQGLAQGLRKATSDVSDATTYVAKTALDSMKTALSGASDLLTNSIDTNPVIAPVVDLTNVSNSVAQLDAILADKKFNIDASIQTAKDASIGYTANKTAVVDTTTAVSAPGVITFIQNNNSPKALSSAEIYRQTNNQLSRVKGALITNAA